MKRVLFGASFFSSILKKEGDFQQAARLYDLCVSKKIKGYITAVAIEDLAFEMEESGIKPAQKRKLLANILNHVSVQDTPEHVLLKALDSKQKVYTLAVLDEAAVHGKLDEIVLEEKLSSKSMQSRVLRSREVLAELG
jgi:hypothetical protein